MRLRRLWDSVVLRLEIWVLGTLRSGILQWDFLARFVGFNKESRRIWDLRCGCDHFYSGISETLDSGILSFRRFLRWSFLVWFVSFDNLQPEILRLFFFLRWGWGFSKTGLRGLWEILWCDFLARFVSIIKEQTEMSREWVWFKSDFGVLGSPSLQADLLRRFLVHQSFFGAAISTLAMWCLLFVVISWVLLRLGVLGTLDLILVLLLRRYLPIHQHMLKLMDSSSLQY